MSDTDAPVVTETTVPKDRLDKEIEKRKQVEAENAEFRRRVEALEDAGKSDIERLTKENERLQKAAEAAQTAQDALSAQVARQERSSMVRAAAEKANILDPDIAIALANLDEITEAGDAKRYAEKLAKEKPHLVKSDAPEKPSLRKVFGPDGAEKTEQPRPVTAEDMKRAQGALVMDEINRAREIAGKEPITPLPAE